MRFLNRIKEVDSTAHLKDYSIHRLPIWEKCFISLVEILFVKLVFVLKFEKIDQVDTEKQPQTDRQTYIHAYLPNWDILSRVVEKVFTLCHHPLPPWGGKERRMVIRTPVNVTMIDQYVCRYIWHVLSHRFQWHTLGSVSRLEGINFSDRIMYTYPVCIAACVYA